MNIVQLGGEYLADKHSPEIRSYNMSRIRSKNTKPEEIVRKYLFSRRLRYRKNDKKLPGKPDIVFPKYNTVVFVNGCFWHSHSGCKDFVMPITNCEFWESKLKRTQIRDAQNIKLLKESGWRVIIVWECELKKSGKNECLEKLYQEITQPLKILV